MADKQYKDFTAGTANGSNILLQQDPGTGIYTKIPTPILTPLYTLDQAIRDAGSPIKAYSVGSLPANGGNGSQPAVNEMYVQLIALPAGTYTGACYAISRVGVYTSTNFNGFALYQVVGSNLSQVAITANTGTWLAVTLHAFTQLAFTSPVTVTQGVYFIAFIFSATSITTAPNLYAGAGSTNTATLRLGMSNSAMAIGKYTSTTTPPSSVAISSMVVTGLPAWWIALY